MLFNFLLLFFTALLAGGLAYFIPSWEERYFKLVLVFAGSYLFAITVLHILPELFMESSDPTRMGLYILLGFLLQQILALLSTGVEHGHIHHPDHAHHHGVQVGVWTIMIGLFLHAFLEGTLLTETGEILGHSHDHDHEGHHHHHSHGNGNLLLGILLHKGPEAFALVAVLMSSIKKRWVFALLVVFALASPLGMLLSNFLYESKIMEKEALNIFYGMVAGGFLHISTTIFFESSPDHRFYLNKVLLSMAAFALAVALEMVV
ncbi:Zinc transporter, ZIP family [Mariniradius saccharolyticus AK6]|uniref:Zinc transporter, ZIP family n=1 Tax=Mariniradius saccharolyticus AK6 TaxID=1239962 RepID=M7XDU0_9BACT|nr:ZIP family metal transporter [Mariniradius saccharolyticus]EMS32723.1 Zinc transporter, ZIP family [Mariniradius saccharolyticus AK6]